jgi:hypothetical protein
MADGSGKKSDPPVGTGRGLKPRAEKPQSKAVRNIRAALFFVAEHKRRNVPDVHSVKNLHKIKAIDSK